MHAKKRREGKLHFVWFAVWEKPSVWFVVCEEKNLLFGLLSEKNLPFGLLSVRKKPSVWFVIWEKTFRLVCCLCKNWCLAGCLCENWCLAGCVCENWYLWCWCRLWTKVSLWELVYVNLGRKIVLMVNEWWCRDVGYFVMDLCV